MIARTLACAACACRGPSAPSSAARVKSTHANPKALPPSLAPAGHRQRCPRRCHGGPAGRAVPLAGRGGALAAAIVSSHDVLPVQLWGLVEASAVLTCRPNRHAPCCCLVAPQTAVGARPAVPVPHPLLPGPVSVGFIPRKRETGCSGSSGMAAKHHAFLRRRCSACHACSPRAARRWFTKK